MTFRGSCTTHYASIICGFGMSMVTCAVQGRIQDLIREGGPQIVTGLKLPFWGLSFVEFWCWGLIFGGRGGPGPPLDPPLQLLMATSCPEVSCCCLTSQHDAENLVIKCNVLCSCLSVI